MLANEGVNRSDLLHTNDVIFLSTSALNENLLHVEGFCDERVGLIDLGSHQRQQKRKHLFRECLFRVTCQLQYTAQNALHRLRSSDKKQSEKGKKSSGERAKTSDQLKYMREKAVREQEKNVHLMESSQPVTYGMIVQIQHLKTGKFLCNVPNQLAEVQSECMKVGLTEGSEEAWFKLLPRFKIRSEGQSV